MDKIRKFKSNSTYEIWELFYISDQHAVLRREGSEVVYSVGYLKKIYTEIKNHEFWVNVYEKGVGFRHKNESLAINEKILKQFAHLGYFVRTEKFTVEV